MGGENQSFDFRALQWKLALCGVIYQGPGEHYQPQQSFKCYIETQRTVVDLESL